MPVRRLIFMLGIAVLVVGVAAFLGGRLLTQRVDPVGPDAPFPEDFRSLIVPAPELPTTLPDVTGPFVTQHDNTIIVEMKSLEAGSLAFALPSNTRNEGGPQVEILLTRETLIYRETTNPGEPLSAENRSIRQTVEPASPEDLDARSMIMAWGRKQGDRVIANVLMYSDLVAVKSAIFQGCEICP
jgi:hypothetical protein